MVIVFLYTQISNNYIVYLKLIMLDDNFVLITEKKWEKNEEGKFSKFLKYISYAYVCIKII